MIKYIHEQEVELGNSHRQAHFHSQSKPITKSPSAIQVPEQLQTSSNALRKLKQFNDRKEMLKGRLSFLQIREERNQNRAILNSQRYQFHRQMQLQLEQSKMDKAQHLKHMLEKIACNQTRARHERLEHKVNLANAQEVLRNSSSQDYKNAKQLLKDIQKTVLLNRQQELVLKRRRQEEVRQYESKQKQNVSRFNQSKIEQIRKRDAEDAMQVSRVQQQRSRQLEQLSRLESVMIERQSRSKMSSDQSARRLRKLVKGKTQSTSHTPKLPSISDRSQMRTNSDGSHQGTQQDMVIV